MKSESAACKARIRHIKLSYAIDREIGFFIKFILFVLTEFKICNCIAYGVMAQQKTI